MKKLILSSIIWLGTLSAVSQSYFPDLGNAGDLAKLGTGRIIGKDNCITKDIMLKEVQSTWIVYVKNESLHDKAFDYIKRLEFPTSAWGAVKVEFLNNKPVISVRSCYMQER